MVFKGSKLVFELLPQSPLIHFQHDENGATVRASEMKPKLDRFLVAQFKREGIDYSAWISKVNDNTKAEALSYKLRMVSSRTYKVDLKKYPIFFGNMGNDNQKMGIISYPKVTITCFKKGLQEQIQKYLPSFFWVTNFGTMQSKGFGGFLPSINNFDETSIIKAFHQAGAKAVYKMNFDAEAIKDIGSNLDVSSSVRMFEEIKKYYGIMKSGQNFKGYARSYIYEYMHQNFHIDNEKAWMKENGISPNLERNHSRDVYQTNPNPRYVRAMYGKGDTIRYQSNDRGRPVNVSIKPAKSQREKIERIPSAILFKIIGKIVYILGLEIPEEIYDKEFDFKGYKKDVLATPSKKDFEDYGGKFPVEDFLDNYMTYYNGKLRRAIRDMADYQMVVKCE